MEVTYQPYSEEHHAALAALTTLGFSSADLPMVVTESELREWMDSPNVNAVEDYRLAFVGDQLVGYGSVMHRPSEGSFARAILNGTIHPDFRRQGIGTSLLQWAEQHGRQKIVDADQGLPGQLWAIAYDNQVEDLALYSKAGFELSRYFHEMLRPLASTEEVAAPADGIEVVPWSDDLESSALSVLNESFRDHWGSLPIDRKSWENWLETEALRLDLSFLAVAAGEVVGLTMNSHYPEDEAVSGRREGWIDTLGTLRAWRKKGVATALMQKSFQAFTGAGFTHAILGVDTESPTGAAALYSNVGFVTERTEVAYIKHF